MSLRYKLVEFFHNMSYRRKLLMSYSAILIIPILILGVFSFCQSRELLVKSKMTDIDYYFEKASNELNQTTETCQTIINTIFTDPTMNNILLYPDDAQKQLQAQNDLPNVLSPYIYNAKQNSDYIREITYYTLTDIPDYRSIIRKLDEQNKTNFPEITDKYTWYYNGHQICVSRAFVGLSYGYRGNLVIQMNPRKLFEIAVSPEFFNYNIAFFSSDGSCIYSRLLPEDKKLSVSSFLSDKQSISVNGNDYLLKNIVLDNGFVLSAFVNKSVLLNGFDSILVTTVVILLICLFVSFIFVIFFSKTLTHRISNLNQQIDLVKHGNLNISIQSEYHDEVGNLTNNFSDMIGHINKLIADIYESQQLQKQSELKALQAQIKPHFLYNILQAVNWNAINRGDDETSRIVVNLSNFYRAVLNKGYDDISVDDELNIVKYYLNIENAIYNNAFTVTYNIEPETLQCLAIPLILQPLVENSIEHGIRKKDDQCGNIDITAIIKENRLVLTVSDSGIGIPPDRRDAILKQYSAGYGLKSINERIQLRFGKKYGLTLLSESDPTAFEISMPAIPFGNH